MDAAPGMEPIDLEVERWEDALGDHAGPTDPKLDLFSPLYFQTPANADALRYQHELLGPHTVETRWSMWPADDAATTSSSELLDEAPL